MTSADDQPTVSTPGALARYAAWVALAVTVGLVGYAGYVVYPRFDLPAGVGAGLLVLAAAAGVAAFFSPCSFPLLVSMLARPLSVDDGSPRRPWRRALGFAAALSAGAIAFLAVVGGLLAVGAAAFFDDVTFTSTAGRVIRIVTGAALVVFGLIQINRLTVNLRRFEPGLHRVLGRQAELRRRRPLAGFALFGFVYLLAGFG